jgi:RNA polymerase sigma-70 factor (ECF subfamily)
VVRDVDEPTALPSPPGDDEVGLVAALRDGDEQAFARLVDQYHASMVRVARAYVATREAAEDVVQDAWLGVIKGLDRFEGRSSLKTWMFRIVINKAMTRGGRDARSVPFSSLAPDEPAVDPDRFFESGRWCGWWLSDDALSRLPDRIVLAKESRAMIDAVIATLPPNQRLVITLRDVQGFSAEEACELLGLSEANQRVLLHRARTRVRTALEGYVGERVGAEP